MSPGAPRQARNWAENIIYRAAGLPITLRALTRNDIGAAAVIRRAYARYYWSMERWQDPVEVLIAILIFPIGILISAIYLSLRNGRSISQTSGTSIPRQFIDQIWLACSRGILPPWYYVFALYFGKRRQVAESFLQRCETKSGVYILLKRQRSSWSPLGDKQAFAHHCERWRLPTVPIFGVAYPDRIEGLAGSRLPSHDLFVKPIDRCGGRGAERWDYVDEEIFVRPDGLRLSSAALMQHLMLNSADVPRIIQPRLLTHPALADLANGALATVRVLTCLNEQEEPELMAALFRMAYGNNHTVDNLHAGGIGSRVELATGELSAATNLGMVANIGWLARHPTSGAAIEGRVIPRWPEVCALAKRAHQAFSDRLFVGWDIAVLCDGPCLVEGNYGPDVDIMQRHCSIGLCNQRFGQLLAWHL